MLVFMIVTVLLVLGLCFGSFVNALVWRLHEQGKAQKARSISSGQAKSKKQSAAGDLSIVHGRSMCPNCHHTLATKDLVPVVSWLRLGGKCRYCHKPISWQYPVVELLTAGLFAFSYLYWPLAWGEQGTTLFVLWLIFLVGLIALAVYDLKWQLLPNKLVYRLMYGAVVQALLLIFVFHGGFKQAGHIALSFIIGGGLFYVLFQVSGGKWIGGGDVKLGMLLGLILAEPELSIFMIFSACLLGTAVSLPLLATHKLKRTSRVPFGPFLIAGTIIARLFGAALISWYKHRLLLGV